MITLKQFLETINYRITEGSEYGWQCFGPRAYCLDHSDSLGFDSKYTSSIIFDKANQTVYCVELHDYVRSNSYRIIHPDFAEQYRAEAAQRGCNDMAYDDVRYVDLETDGDFLRKLEAIVSGVEYDERVEIELDLDEKFLNQLMLLAHERDITLNQLVEDILTEMIGRVKNGEQL